MQIYTLIKSVHHLSRFQQTYATLHDINAVTLLLREIRDHRIFHEIHKAS